MELIYRIFIHFLIFGIKIGGIFNQKLRRGLFGRRQSIDRVKSVFSPKDQVIWMHAASLGEYEQGLPVLEKLKNNFPKCKILITFFSPSGYENVSKRQHIADVICYLPFDTKKELRNFIAQFETKLFFTVKYDFWYHLLQILNEKKIKVYVVSAHFYPKQIFFKFYGKWFVKQLKQNVFWFFHQTQTSELWAKKVGLTQSSTTGDTRFNRVVNQLEADNFLKNIAVFKGQKQTIVFGSCWQPEERIAQILTQKFSEIKLILAPHNLDRIPMLQKVFPQSILYSDLEKIKVNEVEQQVLIVNSIGLLTRMYAFADLAVIGGGFHHKGLHNILEAAVFGVPVFFGNHYTKNPEADGILDQLGGKSFDDEFYASKYIGELINHPEMRKLMGDNAQQFILSQPDSAELILEKIKQDFS